METLFCLHHAEEDDPLFVCPVCRHGPRDDASLMRAIAASEGLSLEFFQRGPPTSARDELQHVLE